MNKASTHRTLSTNTGLEVETLQYRTMHRHIHAQSQMSGSDYLHLWAITTKLTTENDVLSKV